MSPPTPKELESLYGIDRELLVALADRGELVRIGTEAAFLPEPVGTFASTVITELASAKSITIARARDLTGSSRKYVLPLMQFLDDQGVTRRVGDERHLQLDASAARARIEATLRRA